MKKNDLIVIGLLALFCVLFWNLLDFVYTTLISRGAYGFSWFNDVCLPAIIGVTVGYITLLRRRKTGQ